MNSADYTNELVAAQEAIQSKLPPGFTCNATGNRLLVQGNGKEMALIYEGKTYILE